jgi:hypothetical protein
MSSSCRRDFFLDCATATKNSLAALLSATNERLSKLTKENTAFGWVGWSSPRHVQRAKP